MPLPQAQAQTQCLADALIYTFTPVRGLFVCGFDFYFCFKMPFSKTKGSTHLNDTPRALILK